MLGAYFAAGLQQLTGSFFLAVVLAIPLVMVVGILMEIIAIRTGVRVSCREKNGCARPRTSP